MAGTQRAGLSAFWTTITNLALASVVTARDLYDDGINRLADRTVWLRDEINRRSTYLASAVAGTQATIVGSVDLSTLDYDPIAGSLVGLTFQIQADTGGLKTVTFGSGATAPTGPADVVDQIMAATSGQPAAQMTSAGLIAFRSTTTGAGSTIEAVGGSACAVLGFTVGATATGSASGNDGVSMVGGAAVAGASFTIPAGTLRSMLQYIADAAANIDGDKSIIAVSDATQTITPTNALYIVPNVASSDKTITLANPTYAGQYGGKWVRKSGASGQVMNFAREDATALGVLQGNGSGGYLEFRAWNDGLIVRWNVESWGGDLGTNGGGYPL